MGKSSRRAAATAGGLRRVLRVLIGARGATTVEYGIILVAVLLLGAGSFKLLGGSVGKRSGAAGNTITNNEEGSGGGKKGATPAGNNGAKGGGDNGNATSKVKVGGVGGAGETPNPESAGRNRDTSGESGPGGPVGAISNVADKGGTDVADGFGAKRWFGIGLLAVGVIALGYVVMSMRRVKKAGDAVAGDGKTGAGKRKPA